MRDCSARVRDEFNYPSKIVGIVISETPSYYATF